MYEILIYATDSGKEPFAKWLKGLKDRKMQHAVFLRIQRLRRGNFGDCKSISGYKNLYELRIALGPGLRIYFSKVGDQLILILGGGDKKTQSRDIEKAGEYLSYYRSQIVVEVG